MDHSVTTFINRLRKGFPDILDAYLFGSRARGDFRPSSDYDLLLIVPNKTSEIKHKLHGIAEDFWMETGKDFSLKIFSRQQFDKLSGIPTPILQNVLSEGIKVG